MKINKKTFVLQHEQRDCGVACLLSIIKYYGGNNNIDNLRKLSGTNITGTTLLGLYQAAIQTGFDAQGCEANMEALIKHNSPVILHVILENNFQHYIVCYENYKNDKGETIFVIGDPGVGITNISVDKLQQIWKTKACLTLIPNKNFIKAEQTKNEKIKWFKKLLKEDVTLLSASVFIGVAIAVLGLVMAIFSQKLIDDILPKKNFTKLYLGISLVFALLLIKEFFSYIRQFLLLTQSKEFNIRIIDFFYNHILMLPKQFFDTRKIGELTARLNDTQRIQRVISQIIGNVIIDSLISIASFAFIFIYSWKIGIFAIITLPFYFILIFSKNKKILTGQRQIMSNYALAESNYISTIQGIEPIKNYNKQNLFAKSNKSIYQNFQNSIFSLGKVQINLSLLANIFGVSFLISVLFYTSHQVLNNNLKTGELIAIIGICGSLLPSIANLALIAIPINEAKIAFDRMFEFTSINPETSIKNNEISIFESLKVENLSFRFAGRNRILNDVSFEISKGEIIAIVGENGCGKSTLTQIIQKHYAQETGNIYINKNLSLLDISNESWRNIIGVVPQNIHIFNGTVIENIAFDDASTKPQEVIQFLNKFGFINFINQLPQSFVTLIGEEGINLSGGQKQIITLARALYHKPQLLILDEATASMDKQTEDFTIKLLNNIKKETGIIFITHKLNILNKFCDKIYILENGKINNFGNHNYLIKYENLYSNFWNEINILQ